MAVTEVKLWYNYYLFFLYKKFITDKLEYDGLTYRIVLLKELAFFNLYCCSWRLKFHILSHL